MNYKQHYKQHQAFLRHRESHGDPCTYKFDHEVPSELYYWSANRPYRQRMNLNREWIGLCIPYKKRGRYGPPKPINGCTIEQLKSRNIIGVYFTHKIY